MKYNHCCEHTETCDNYLYSTCEGCNLNKGSKVFLSNLIYVLYQIVRGSVTTRKKDSYDSVKELFEDNYYENPVYETSVNDGTKVNEDGV